MSAGERGLQAAQRDVPPGSGLLRPLHGHAEERAEVHAAAHRHHVSVHRRQSRGLCERRAAAGSDRAPSERCFLSARQEMYPPKVHHFAYVTNKACTEDEILSMEIIVMKVTAPLHRSVFQLQLDVVLIWKNVHVSALAPQ